MRAAPSRKVILSKANKDLRALLKWAHGVQLAQGFPFSMTELQTLRIEQLRFIARLCPDFVQRAVLYLNRHELITWILGYQPQRSVEPWSAPVMAAEIPTLEELRPPRR